MKYIKFWPVILAALLFSCGPQAKLRRAERLIAKAEAQGARWKVDTVFKEITVYTTKIEFDTVLKQVNFHDTITVIKDNVITRFKINTVTKDIYVNTECPPDTIEILVPVTVNKEINAKKRSWTFYVAWALLLMIAAFVAGYIVRAQVKKDLTIRFDREKPPEM